VSVAARMVRLVFHTECSDGGRDFERGVQLEPVDAARGDAGVMPIASLNRGSTDSQSSIR
jgi:hypothetical protein